MAARAGLKDLSGGSAPRPVLAEIELRVEVELAKMGTAADRRPGPSGLRGRRNSFPPPLIPSPAQFCPPGVIAISAREPGSQGMVKSRSGVQALGTKKNTTGRLKRKPVHE